MNKDAITRLILTGPSEEIARFVRECIRVQKDAAGDGLCFDFDAIVPMPPEIAAIREDATDEQLVAAYTATGFDDRNCWCDEHWGTDQNAYNFCGTIIGDTIYDCIFSTAWSSPIPVLRALTSVYPRLQGAMVALEANGHASLAGIIRDGGIVYVDVAYDDQMTMLVFGGKHSLKVAFASVEALLAMLDGPILSLSSEDAHHMWSRALRAVERMGQLVGGDLPERIAFERIVRKVCDLLDAGHGQDVIAHELERAPETVRHVAFLFAYDRARTALDRKLLRILALCLRIDGVSDEGDAKNYADEIEFEILDDLQEDDLYDWACLAMFRPGVVFDFTYDALLEGFQVYAEQLRVEILAHFRGPTDACCLPVAA